MTTEKSSTVELGAIFAYKGSTFNSIAYFSELITDDNISGLLRQCLENMLKGNGSVAAL